jgi:hypothetical protein
MKDDFVATTVIRSTGYPGKEARMELLSTVIEQLENMTDGHGIILFPAGYFNTGQEEASTILRWVEKEIRGKLAKIKWNIIVCVGIDGNIEGNLAKDQLALAVNTGGISAMARKFYPAKGEKGKIHRASNHLSEEQGYPRIFSLNTRRYYIAVCYDVFGIRKRQLKNPNVSAILNCVHGFYRREQGASGNAFFARHGFAGASKQWGSPVFGAAVFFDRHVPEDWPTGVYWNQGNKSTIEWGYSNNPIKKPESLCISISRSQEIALVNIYDLANCLGI